MFGYDRPLWGYGQVGCRGPPHRRSPQLQEGKILTLIRLSNLKWVLQQINSSPFNQSKDNYVVDIAELSCDWLTAERFYHWDPFWFWISYLNFALLNFLHNGTFNQNYFHSTIHPDPQTNIRHSGTFEYNFFQISKSNMY